MHMKYPQWMAHGALLAGLLLSSIASGARPAPPDPTQDRLMVTAGFLNGHPDLRFRLLALEKYKAGSRADAMRFFQYASQYADKPSQAMVAEMLWNGDGTPKDRALAYAWMDLAAERGYAGFLELRERYWQQLNGDERERALQEGEAIYARYGDTAAKPRIAAVLRRERRSTTGSRTGFTGSLRILVPGAAGPQEIDGSKFYDDRYWDPALYQAWHDSVWKKPRIASVNVGGIEQIDKDTVTSRIQEVAPEPDVPEPDVDGEMPALQDGPARP
jgi:hypothetical protein